MISVYKIGKSLYENKRGFVIDKNSGYYEYEYIKTECENIHTNKKVLVIINGRFDYSECRQELLDYTKLFDVRIFIASDIISLTDNQDIINACDYLLHQCPTHRFCEFPQLKQHYSYVPELFYKYCQESTFTKDELLIFGGGVRDNEAKIAGYLNAVPSVAFIKTNVSDNRLEYNEYLKELSKHSYALIISRKKYSEIGWVTARFAEAIAKNCIPIVDAEYDKTNYFMVDKISSKKELVKLINFYSTHPQTKQQILSHFRNVLTNRSNAFAALIRGICNE